LIKLRGATSYKPRTCWIDVYESMAITGFMWGV
jgi:hypothetical protein